MGAGDPSGLVLPMLVMLSFVMVGTGNRAAWALISGIAIALLVAATQFSGLPPGHLPGYQLPPVKQAVWMAAQIFAVVFLLPLPVWAVLFRRWREKRSTKKPL